MRPATRPTSLRPTASKTKTNARTTLRCDLSHVQRGGGIPHPTKSIIVMTTPTPSGRTGDAHDDVERRAAIAPLLGGVGEGDRRRVIEACIRRRFRRGQALFHEGDPGESLHFLTSGFVVVQVTTPFGEIATINVMGAPDTVGELALLDRYGRRSASVVAITPVETLALDRGAFERLRTEHPVVERILVTILSVHVRRLSDRLTEALYVPAETRVFLRLA